MKNKKVNKNTVTLIDKVKLVASVLILIIIIAFGIVSIVKKEEKNTISTEELHVSLENNGEILFHTKEKENMLSFKIKNDSQKKKNYSIGLKGVSNTLKNLESLTYDLKINGIEEIQQEIFPNEDILLIDGAEIDVLEELECQLIIKYLNEESNEEETIKGKIMIEED